MTTENKTLMQAARTSLENKWGLAIVTFLVYKIIVSISSYAGIIIAGPFSLGVALFSLNISRNNEIKLKQIFDGFKRFGDSLIAYLLILVQVILWTLLLIVPGVIKAISYSMTYFIMIDEPSLKPKEAMDKSEQMMNGFKMKYFRLLLRFSGWSLVCILTLGIGFLWLIPYMYVTNAKFYEDIKNSVATERLN